jgi:glucose-6-phosphate isomerase
MIDLSAFTGMPLFLDETELVFSDPADHAGAIRRREINSLKDVWMDPALSGEGTVYTTYTDVARPENRKILATAGIERGVVVMPPRLYGREYPKLFGHYHPLVRSTGLSTPEVHSVLQGSCHFLLQKSVPPYDEIEDVILVEARAGDIFIVPPNYGHVSINPSGDVLVFDGFLMRNLDANYEPYRRYRGAAYYEIIGKDGSPELIANMNYTRLPPIRRVLARDVQKMEELNQGACPYDVILRHLPSFGFLTKPEEYQEKWRF